MPASGLGFARYSSSPAVGRLIPSSALSLQPKIRFFVQDE
jgi:hypothetical protein